MSAGASALREIPVEQCWTPPATQEIGRPGVHARGHPPVVQVDCVLDVTHVAAVVPDRVVRPRPEEPPCRSRP